MGPRGICFALILVLGTHVVTSKSVVESFKDELAHPRELVLIKRDVNEESSVAEEQTTEEGEDTTTPPSTESVESDETTLPPAVTSTKPPKPRRQTVRPSVAPEATTPSSAQDRSDDAEPIVEEADDQEEADTVKPVEIEKPKPPKKQRKPKPAAPSLASRSQPEENGESMAASGVQQPAANLLPPMPSANIPPRDFIPPQYPAFGFAPQPAIPGPYYYPQPSGPAFSDPQVGHGSNGAFSGSFASASASASANGQGATVSTSTFPGSGTQQSSSSFSGPIPGGAVGAQSSGPFGGSFGRPGVQHSSSSSSSFPGGVSQQSSSSSSSSSSPGGFSQQSSSSSSGPFPATSQNSGSFINVRGSFGDNESVGIEVNGAEPTGNAAPAPAYGYSNPSYAGPSSYNVPYYNSYNSIPNYSPYGNPTDVQNYFQQYFAALQAQQQAFQQQLQAQFQAQQQAGGASATAGAFMSDSRGQADPNAQVFVSTQSSPGSASSSTSVDSRFGLGGAKSTAIAQLPADKNSKNSFWDQNRIDGNFNNVPSGSYYNGPQTASASGSIGPNGGFQTGQISPAAPGIFSRFSESVPAPSGNSYGVFSSSSSSSSTGPDGKVHNQKSATVAVNDNGKISVKHIHDP